MDVRLVIKQRLEDLGLHSNAGSKRLGYARGRRTSGGTSFMRRIAPPRQPHKTTQSMSTGTLFSIQRSLARERAGRAIAVRWK